jgi:hypothetical protein
MEPFVADVTAQAGSLQEAASTQELLSQQLQGYLQRLKAAVCADLSYLQAQIDALGPGGATSFLGLSDTPASYAGAAGQVVQVNAGETGLEFAAAGGGEVWKISERRAEATTAIKAGSPAANINFEVAGINDAGGDLTWDAVNFAWENTSGATLYVNVLVTIACQAGAGPGRPAFVLRLDTGGGFADIAGSTFWSETGRMSASKVYRIDLDAGDKIAVGGFAIVGAVNMIAGSSFQLLSRTTTP